MSPGKKITVGTRASALALKQTNAIIESLRLSNPGVEFVVNTIKTKGDKSQDAALLTIGKGVFVKEIEDSLLSGEIDMAVHSLKDLLTVIPSGLALGAISEREDARDVLINRWRLSLKDMPSGARIGTSSPRRAAFLKALRPDLIVLPMRGNVDTRLKKAASEEYDGTILAAAGVIRMGRQEEVTQYLPTEDFVPAVGQGALAVEIREDDKGTLAVVSKVNHQPTSTAVTAERSFLAALGGGCAVPVAAYGKLEKNRLRLVAAAASEDGKRIFRVSLDAGVTNPQKAGEKLARALLDSGASEIL